MARNVETKLNKRETLYVYTYVCFWPTFDARRITKKKKASDSTFGMSSILTNMITSISHSTLLLKPVLCASSFSFSILMTHCYRASSFLFLSISIPYIFIFLLTSKLARFSSVFFRTGCTSRCTWTHI